MKKVIAIIMVVLSLLLTSCSDPVNYSVDKKDEAKMKTIQKMVLALVENDTNSYLSCFEPSYIENIRKSIDTLGTQYYGAENFNDFMKSSFVKNPNKVTPSSFTLIYVYNLISIPVVLTLSITEDGTFIA